MSTLAYMFSIKPNYVFDGFENADMKRHSGFCDPLLTRVSPAEDVDVVEPLCQILEAFFDGLANFAGSLKCLLKIPFSVYTVLVILWSRWSGLTSNTILNVPTIGLE